jgi:hypothetical protein
MATTKERVKSWGAATNFFIFVFIFAGLLAFPLGLLAAVVIYAVTNGSRRPN